MLRCLSLAVAVGVLTVLATSCGNDDNNTSPSAAGSLKPSATASGEASEAATPADLKTPPGETAGEETPAPTISSRATAAAEGTPAPVISDVEAFFKEKFPGKSPIESNCQFDLVTVVVTCDGVRYAVNPPLAGQDISCFQLSVDNKPVAIRCTSQQPLQAIYYEIPA